MPSIPSYPTTRLYHSSFSRRRHICFAYEHSRLGRKGRYYPPIATSELLRGCLAEQILADEKLVTAFAVGFINRVEVDIIRYIQIKSHHMYRIVLTQRHRPALASAVVDEYLEKRKVLGTALKIESKQIGGRYSSVIMYKPWQ